ncbi:DDX18, partial [Cordylochernes scorpioides]
MAASDMRNRRHVQPLLTWSTNAAHPVSLESLKGFKSRGFEGKKRKFEEATEQQPDKRGKRPTHQQTKGEVDILDVQPSWSNLRKKQRQLQSGKSQRKYPVDTDMHVCRDVAASAKTGSGKTLAFLVPVLERLSKEGSPGKNTWVIVMSPTRELANQIYNVLSDLLIPYPTYTYGLLMGGTNRKAEIKWLRKGITFLVATPGRLLDHLKLLRVQTGAIKAKALKCLIVDEADKLLEIGFLADIKEILHLLPMSQRRARCYNRMVCAENRQTLLFSATIRDSTRDLLRVALKPGHIGIGIEPQTDVSVTVEGLKQVYVLVPLKLRLVLLINLLRLQHSSSKLMVFFSTSDSVIFHQLLLSAVSIPCLAIHGKLKQKKRKPVLNEFVGQEHGILLCTDVAARGLDIPQVDCVIQFDAPLSTTEYIHRVGRTARGVEGTGNAILFLRPDEF